MDDPLVEALVMESRLGDIINLCATNQELRRNVCGRRADYFWQQRYVADFGAPEDHFTLARFNRYNNTHFPTWFAAYQHVARIVALTQSVFRRQVRWGIYSFRPCIPPHDLAAEARWRGEYETARVLERLI